MMHGGMIQNFTGERRDRGDQCLSVFVCGILRPPVNMTGFLVFYIFVGLVRSPGRIAYGFALLRVTEFWLGLFRAMVWLIGD